MREQFLIRKVFRLGRATALSLIVCSSMFLASASAMVLAQTDATSTLAGKQQEAETLWQQGRQLYRESKLDAALQKWEQSLQIYEQIGDLTGQGRVINSIGVFYDTRGVTETALDFYHRSLSISRQVGDRITEAKVLSNLGVLYQIQGDYEESIQFHSAAIKLSRELGNSRSEATSNLSLGKIYENLGNYEKSIFLYKKSLEIGIEIKDKTIESGALNSLASPYVARDQYQEAIAVSHKALDIDRSMGDRFGEEVALDHLGKIYLFLGRLQDALNFHQQSLQLAQEIKNERGVADSFHRLAETYFNLHDNQQAEKFFSIALEYYRAQENLSGEARATSGLGNVAYREKDYSQSEIYYLRALKIQKDSGNRSDQASTLSNLGNAYSAQGNLDQAFLAYEQALEIAKSIGDRLRQAEVIHNLGVESFKRNDFQQSQQYFEQATQTWETIRLNLNDEQRISIFERQASSYQNLQKSWIALGNPTMALEAAEKSRARALVQTLIERQLDGEQATAPLQPPTAKKIKDIAAQQQSYLVQYSILSEEDKINDNRLDTGAELYIWVVSPQGMIQFRSVDLEQFLNKSNLELNELITQTRQALGVRGRSLVAEYASGADQDKQLQALYQLLVEPIVDLLPEDPHERVTFIPHGALFSTPFAALQNEQGETLLEQHTILTAPAIQVLDLANKIQSRRETNFRLQDLEPGQSLILGNPTMPKVSTVLGQDAVRLNSLPGAELEAREIAKLLKTTAILGEHASKKKMMQRMQDAKLIHLATHGFLDDFNGQGIPGAIALAPDGNGDRNDGLLTADEILELDLQADLVVLSACDTGGGRITGDGVVGLSRSLLLAGAPSIVVSLWQVPDQPTAKLMASFYQYLWNGMDKAEALRSAMLETKAEFPNPRDWAGFTLIGESE